MISLAFPKKEKKNTLIRATENAHLPLPPEIRNLIYSNVLRSHSIIRPTAMPLQGPPIPPHNTNALALVAVSKQTRAETMSTFFGEKWAYLGGAHQVLKWLRMIGPEARACLTRVSCDVLKVRYAKEALGLLVRECRGLREVGVRFAEEALLGEWRRRNKWWSKERYEVLLEMKLPGFLALLNLRGLETFHVLPWPCEKCLVTDGDRRNLRERMRVATKEGCEAGRKVLREGMGDVFDTCR
jgi:hypothetical protein